LAATPTCPGAYAYASRSCWPRWPSPLDLVPDVLPVVGYADDAIIATALLRSVARHAGLATVRRHWPGTPDGFAALCHLTGLPNSNPTPRPPA
jgi:hypothetical protein